MKDGLFEALDFVAMPWPRGKAEYANRANTIHSEGCPYKNHDCRISCGLDIVEEQYNILKHENMQVREALTKIRSLTGPPKMSETMGTAFVRLREIRTLTSQEPSKEVLKDSEEYGKVFMEQNKELMQDLAKDEND